MHPKIFPEQPTGTQCQSSLMRKQEIFWGSHKKAATKKTGTILLIAQPHIKRLFCHLVLHVTSCIIKNIFSFFLLLSALSYPKLLITHNFDFLPVFLKTASEYEKLVNQTTQAFLCLLLQIKYSNFSIWDLSMSEEMSAPRISL